MKKKIWIIIIAVTVIVITLIVIITTFLHSKIVKTITNTDDYEKIFELTSNSELPIFPDSIEDKDVKEFYYKSYSTMFDDIQIILSCEYTEEEYEEEVIRLQNQKHEGFYEGGLARYDEDNFEYPAYVMRLAYDSSSEYALLDKDNYTIIYIYVDGMKKSLIRFDHDYLPKGYKEYGECNESYCQ